MCASWRPGYVLSATSRCHQPAAITRVATAGVGSPHWTTRCRFRHGSGRLGSDAADCRVGRSPAVRSGSELALAFMGGCRTKPSRKRRCSLVDAGARAPERGRSASRGRRTTNELAVSEPGLRTDPASSPRVYATASWGSGTLISPRWRDTPAAANRALRHSAPHARGGRFQAEAALRGRWERALANRPIRVVSRQPGRSAASTRKRKPPSRCEGWSSRLFAGQQHAIAQKDLSGARAATSSPGRQAGPLFSTTSEAPASDSHDAGHARTVAPVPPESRGASPRSEAHHPPPPHPEALRRSFAVARQGVLSWGRRVFRRSSGW
jgi:hypothetical protein